VEIKAPLTRNKLSFVLNLPSAFRMGWNMIAPLLDERTKAKLHLLGPKQLGVLQEYIPKDQLEKVFGGTHGPYPRPDAFVEELQHDGILVETGFFQGLFFFFVRMCVYSDNCRSFASSAASNLFC